MSRIVAAERNSVGRGCQPGRAQRAGQRLEMGGRARRIELGCGDEVTGGVAHDTARRSADARRLKIIVAPVDQAGSSRPIEKAGPHKFTIRADGRDVYSFTVLAKLRDS